MHQSLIYIARIPLPPTPSYRHIPPIYYFHMRHRRSIAAIAVVANSPPHQYSPLIHHRRYH